MSLLTELSIIIPTCNRQEFVLRNMRYWSDYELTLYVLDGTSESISSAALASLGDNIKYYHMPISLMERLFFSIGLVETKYAMMMGDDEFYVPSALQSCVKELSDNEELVSCMGRAASFQVKKSDVLWSVIYPCLASAALEQDNPSCRSVYHMSNYCPSIIYSVMKTEVWAKSMRSLSYKNYEVYVESMGELQFEIVGSYLGKSSVIEQLMWLRSTENDPNRSHQNGTAVPIAQWWRKPNNKSIKDEIIRTMVESILDRCDNYPLVASHVSQAVDAYLEQHATKNKTTFKQKIVSVLPNRIVNILKWLLLVVHRMKSRPQLEIEDLIDKLEGDCVQVDKDELYNIVSIISLFHAVQSDA